MKALWVRFSVVLAVLAFSALYFVPQTGWILRTQLRMIASTLPEKALMLSLGIEPEKVGLSKEESARVKALTKQRLSQVAERFPDDERLQIAFVLATSEHDLLPDRLRDLLRRFPNSPMLHAAILRYDCLKRIHLDRKERYLLSESPVPTKLLRSDPRHLVAFEGIAAKGERIDPDNAFFPMMRAVALFAAHRDEEALQALMRASRKSRWDDYALDEFEGIKRLWEDAFGKPNGLQKISLSAFILPPHLSVMRAPAYIATYKAMELERSGRLSEGLEIRLALMRCGRLMREQRKTTLARTVGTAIAHIAVNRPKGEPLPPPPRKAELAEARGKQIQERFVSYLRQIGQAETAKWVQEELRAGRQLRQELIDKVQRSPYLDELASAWAVDLMLLSVIAILLAMWSIAGISVGVERLAMGGKQISEPEQRPMKFAAVLLLAVWLASVVWLWKVGAIKWLWVTYDAAMAISSLSEKTTLLPPPLTQAILLNLVAMGTLAFAVVVGILVSRKGVAFSRALVQGVWQWALPMAAMIFLLYAVNLVITAIWEGRLYIPI